MPAPQLDFVAVGPFKTGTTWIYDYLSTYNQVALPSKVKEIYFFDRKFDKGFNWYFEHFESLESGKIVGEVAPSYFSSPVAPARIHQLNPNCQILVTLREPISRLKSFYFHMRQRGEISSQLSFIEALSEKTNLVETGKYYSHLSRWIDTFGAERVKVIFFEKLQQSPADFATILCEKLNLKLELTVHDLSRKVNASQAPSNHYLARITYLSVALFHDWGLHWLVEYGKNLGFKKLLFSRKTSSLELNPQDYAEVFELIRSEIVGLETDLGLDLSEWKEIWQKRGIQLAESLVLRQI